MKYLTALAIAALLILTPTGAAAHHGEEVSTTRGNNGGPTIRCPQRPNAHFIACQHARHGHRQWRQGRGTPGHTWAVYRYEAAVLRAYLRALEQPRPPTGGGNNGCAPGNPGACANLIRSMFAQRGLDGEAAVRVATCESGLNPNAYNGSSGASGLFQQLARYWDGRASAYGFAGRSPFDPVANTGVSAAMVAGSGWSHWSCQP